MKLSIHIGLVVQLLLVAALLIVHTNLFKIYYLEANYQGVLVYCLLGFIQLILFTIRAGHRLKTKQRLLPSQVAMLVYLLLVVLLIFIPIWGWLVIGGLSTIALFTNWYHQFIYLQLLEQ
jgi:uncharacterized membrane protein